MGKLRTDLTSPKAKPLTLGYGSLLFLYAEFVFFFNILATMKTWKNISIFVAVPAILICAYNAWVKEKEHHTHPRPEFLEYPHLRIRNKVN